jgi:SAM-dependent methyltransferase
MTDPQGDPAFALSFGGEAARYARFRPSYPVEAIEYVLDGRAPRRILDLGAGTGKLTESLIGRAPEIIAVEPDPAMLAELTRRIPAIEAKVGSAQDIPLPDGSVDAIFVGQAFHWFPRPVADEELARVLRPGGVLGLIWNFLDRDVEWVPMLYRATNGDVPTPLVSGVALVQSEDFTDPEEKWFNSVHRLAGPDGLLQLAHTWSWVIVRSDAEQREIDRRIRDVMAGYPELQGDNVLLPQRTRVIRQYRR